jgi:hypothetical protein
MGVEEAYNAAITNKPACGSINMSNQFSNTEQSKTGTNNQN